MPANVVQTPHEEKLWSQAKAQVRKEYPDVDEESDKYWSLINGIFQRMKHHVGGGEMPAKKSLVLRVTR